jgi:hypothetical protein
MACAISTFSREIAHAVSRVLDHGVLAGAAGQ